MPAFSATTMAIVSTIPTTETTGQILPSRAACFLKMRLMMRPAATGRATTCRMLLNMSHAGTDTVCPRYSEEMSGVSTIPAAVEQAVMVIESATSPPAR